MELNLLVVEDLKVLRDTVSKFAEQMPNVHKVYTAENSDEMFLKLNENKDINGLILDIDLGVNSLDGMTAYGLCKEFGFDLPAIIITGNKVEAEQTHGMGIVDVISKSNLHDFKRIKEAINNLFLHREWNLYKKNKGVIVPVNGEKNLTVFPSEIIYIDSSKGEVYVHTTRKEKGYFTYLKLNFYQDILGDMGFISPHRSFIVNTAFIKEKFDDYLEMIDGEKIPISSNKHDFVENYLLVNDGFSIKHPKSTMLSKFITFSKGMLLADEGGI